jgi:hypothetical protein
MRLSSSCYSDISGIDLTISLGYIKDRYEIHLFNSEDFFCKEGQCYIISEQIYLLSQTQSSIDGQLMLIGIILLMILSIYISNYFDFIIIAIIIIESIKNE